MSLVERGRRPPHLSRTPRTNLRERLLWRNLLPKAVAASGTQQQHYPKHTVKQASKQACTMEEGLPRRVAPTTPKYRVCISDPRVGVAAAHESAAAAMCVRLVDVSGILAIHIPTRSLLRSSSTHEPSDPPLRVVLYGITPGLFLSRLGSGLPLPLPRETCGKT